MEGIVSFISTHMVIGIALLWLFMISLHLVLQRPKSKRAYQICLQYFLLFNLVIAFSYTAYLHLFNADFAADLAGLAPSLFQREIGFACIGIALLGLLGLQASWAFQAAALLIYATITWGMDFEFISKHLATHHSFDTELWIEVIHYTALPAIGLLLLMLTFERRIFR